jgi:hypothetical protein
MLQSARPVGVGVRVSESANTNPVSESVGANANGIDAAEDEDADDEFTEDDADVHDAREEEEDAWSAASAESALEEIRHDNCSGSGSTDSTDGSTAASAVPASQTYSELESLHIVLAHANAWVDPTDEAASTPIIGAASGAWSTCIQAWNSPQHSVYSQHSFPPTPHTQMLFDFCRHWQRYILYSLFFEASSYF